MTKNAAKINAGIMALVNGPNEIITGTVVPGSLDTSAYTISVQPSDDSTPITGVLLGAVTDSGNGMMLFPEDGSNVVMASLDGGGDWTLTGASTLKKATIKIGSSTMSVTSDVVEFNGGGLGGLVKVMDLTTKLNNLEHLVTHLIAVYNMHTHSGGTLSGSTDVPAILETGTLTPTNAEEITNDHITQG